VVPPVGFMTTTLELNPTSRQVILHRAKTIGNHPSDLACRTKLEAVVKGDLEKLTEHCSMGWLLVSSLFPIFSAAWARPRPGRPGSR
jgi:hypothetical protein